MASKSTAQPWLYSPVVDFVLIFLPPIIAILAVLFFKNDFDKTSNIPVWAWISFVLCIDVSHVYSTIFRTYLNSVEFSQNRLILTLVPILAWLAGVFIYSISSLLFWRVLAYVAVFHFIRQQYGFMMLYARNESYPQSRFQWVDKSLIYLSTLYPIVYWHIHLPRNFHWFIDGDFIPGLPTYFEPFILTLYLCAAVVYLYKEIANYIKFRHTSIPKQLVLILTSLTWYIGIVSFNGDMAFTIINVVSHGIPYIGLVWIYGHKIVKKSPDSPLIANVKFSNFFSLRQVPLFLLTLLSFAYIEEGLWDGLVWREHPHLFYFFSQLPEIVTHETLAWIVPLLSLPQVTHYVLDGFIWKLRDRNSNWQAVVLHNDF